MNRFPIKNAFARGRRSFSTVKLPPVKGEHMYNYAPGCPERAALKEAIETMKGECPEIPCIIDGQEVKTYDIHTQVMPSNHGHKVCTYHKADVNLIRAAVESNRRAKLKWEHTPFEDRAQIYLNAAHLLSTKYRAEVCAAVMLGTGKNVWQAEIDAAAETVDFLRYGPTLAQTVYDMQPLNHSPGVWNRQEHRALEGFVAAITPFNFCAIGLNLPATPALLGNVATWKPSSTSILGNYLTLKLMMEAGLPDGVINFVPSSGKDFGTAALAHPDMAGVHFTGSTNVFNQIFNNISEHMDLYGSYPRIVGETGGKNYHFVHKSANAEHVTNNTIRSAFEYQGQKCSACSRAYIPDNLWPEIKSRFLEEIPKIKMGQPEDFSVFMTAVIDQKSFDNAKSYIEWAKVAPHAEILIGGECDDSKGYFISPTVVVVTDPFCKIIQEEIFAPILTVYVYPEDDYAETLEMCNRGSIFGLTGSIFSKDRYATRQAMKALRHSAGNLYINDKSTGAVVGEQPFGGGRKSGTNDKAGSAANYFRWVSSQTIKESSDVCTDWRYPHMA